MQIKVITPGVLSTVQDLGRNGYLSQAVPISGAMDKLSARVANLCLGNNENDAVIEFTYANASLITETDILMAYAGDGATIHVDGLDLPVAQPVFIPEGATVTLKPTIKGCRTYLAVAGGWDVAEVLHSKSTFLTAGFGGFKGRQLKSGDSLKSASNLGVVTQNVFDELKSDQIGFPEWRIAREFTFRDHSKAIRVIAGCEWDWFEPVSRDDFFNSEYRVSTNSNRMGYNLDGTPLRRLNQSELLSTAVVPGTIQIPGDGHPILLMADAQTTGGYPRIGKVAAVDLDTCAQLKPGHAIRFTPMTVNEAEMLYIEQELNLKKLAAAIKLKYT